MNVEQQLHRVAHRVRELEVDVPEFVPPRRTTSRRAAPVLAGLLVLGGAASVMTQQTIPAAEGVPSVGPATAEVMVSEPTTGAQRPVVDPPAMSVHDEISLIRSLRPDADRAGTTEVLSFRVPSGVS